MARRAMLSDATVKAIADRATEPRILEDQTHSVQMPPTQADNKPVKISASQRKQSAREVADRIAGNADITAHFEAEFQRKTGTARFPVELMIDVWVDHPLHDASKPGLRTADVLASPVYGSYYDEGRTTGELKKAKEIIATASNAMADKYNILVPKKGGGTRSQVNGGSWYADVAASHPLGLSLIKEIEEMALGLESPRKGKYKDDARVNVETFKANAEQQLRSIASSFGKAFALVKLFHTINTEMKDNVEAKVLTTAIDKDRRQLAAVTTPIVVYDLLERANYEKYTVGSFLRLDVAKAIAEGGTFKALLDSFKETPGDNDEEEGEKEDTSIATVDAVHSAMAGTLAFLEDRGRYSLYVKELNSKNEQEAEDLVTLTVALRDQLDALIKSHKLVERNQKIMRRQSSDKASDAA